jgi:hypothetical protein
MPLMGAIKKAGDTKWQSMQAQVNALAKTVVAVAVGCPCRCHCRRCRACCRHCARRYCHCYCHCCHRHRGVVPCHRRRQRQQQQAWRHATTVATIVAAVDARGGSARIMARHRRPLQPIATTSPMRIGIISALVAAAVPLPYPHLPLPLAMTGSVAVDVY